MRYTIDHQRELVFAKEARDTFNAYRSSVGTEAGGILLGRVFPHEVQIDIGTAPTAADRSGRYFFDRNRDAAQTAVDRAWKRSSGERIYLGEWHSHPEQKARPSHRDTTMILNMLRDTKMEVSFLFLVVLAMSEDWVGIASAAKVRRLKPTEKK